MEKPTKVEVGQRWVEDDEGANPYTVTAVSPEKGAQIRFDDQRESDGYWHKSASILGDIFLGGPASPERPVMEARGDGYPARCLGCGCKKETNYHCDACQVPVAMGERQRAWDAGARDFPRPGVQTPPAPPVEQLPVPTQAERRQYQRDIMEMHSPEGMPLTALEKIRAKAKPEPWTPSVDEWDLLPSVDE